MASFARAHRTAHCSHWLMAGLAAVGGCTGEADVCATPVEHLGVVPLVAGPRLSMGGASWLPDDSLKLTFAAESEWGARSPASLDVRLPGAEKGLFDVRRTGPTVAIYAPAHGAAWTGQVRVRRVAFDGEQGFVRGDLALFFRGGHSLRANFDLPLCERTASSAADDDNGR